MPEVNRVLDLRDQCPIPYCVLLGTRASQALRVTIITWTNHEGKASKQDPQHFTVDRKERCRGHLLHERWAMRTAKNLRQKVASFKKSGWITPNAGVSQIFLDRKAVDTKADAHKGWATSALRRLLYQKPHYQPLGSISS